MDHARRPLILWLTCVCCLIAAMVVVGGITRLTHSGLSIVEWAPLFGAIPPLSEADWQRVFGQYQRFPEYLQVNSAMTLAEFKRIFFWEYLHRLLGRLIGAAVLLPGLWLLWQRRLPGPLLRRLCVVFALGGLQGLLGWYMVKSGLVDVPRVSPYRLAMHLGLAFGLFGYLWWLLLGLLGPRSRDHRLRVATFAFLGLLALQILYGALVAGLKAGYGFNTFPLMGERLIPEGLGLLAPLWRNLFENNTTVQFIHRTLATALLLSGVGLFLASRALPLAAGLRRRYLVLLGALGLQFSLGVATLLLVVPVGLAASHQAGALALLAAALWALF